MVTMILPDVNLKNFKKVMIIEGITFIFTGMFLGRWRNKVNVKFRYHTMINLFNNNRNIKPLKRW